MNRADPSARVFVRFAEGRVAADAGAALRAAGYEIERVPAWAPHTAWVRPHATTPPDPDALARIPGVVLVEPESQLPRAKKVKGAGRGKSGKKAKPGGTDP
jgi:hypothetical protein